MAYNYPYGNGQQLNLDWFLNEWKNLLAAWEAEKNGIEGALQAEIDRVEAALADVFAARDAAAQSAANALESKNAAAQSASDASGYLATVRADANTASNAAQNAAQSESNAAESAQTALASKNNASNSERNAAQSEANALASKNAAAQSAEDALANKNAAAQSAEDALTNKNAAAQSAEDARDAAELIDMNATERDVGKALIVKTVANGKVTAYEFGEAGGGGETDRIVNTIKNVPIASFEDGINAPVLKLEAEIAPVQSGSGIPSPDNIRPITGWTSCNIYHSGEDTSNPEIIPITFPSEVGTVYGGTLTNLGTNEWKLSITAELEVFNKFSANVISSQINSLGIDSAGVSTLGNFTRISFAVRTEVDQTKYNRLSSTYQYKMCNIANHAFAYNEESTHWYRNSSLYIFLPASIVGSTAQSVVNYLVSIKDTNPLSLWIPYNTPIEYTLTTSEVIQILTGHNNIWAETGNINLLQYYVDSKNYIEEQDALVKALIAPVLNDMIADTALLVNDFRIVNDALYRITSPVAAGATLTPNTNCTATTITEVIKTLLS